MVPMPKASLEQMLATIPLEGRRILDQKVSDIHLDEIARTLINWKSVCTKLGINEAEEEAIKDENRSTDEQRYALLLKLILLWFSFFCGNEATNMRTKVGPRLTNTRQQ